MNRVGWDRGCGQVCESSSPSKAVISCHRRREVAAARTRLASPHWQPILQAGLYLAHAGLAACRRACPAADCLRGGGMRTRLLRQFSRLLSRGGQACGSVATHIPYIPKTPAAYRPGLASAQQFSIRAHPTQTLTRQMPSSPHVFLPPHTQLLEEQGMPTAQKGCNGKPSVD